MRRATVHDVAAKAGVSLASVDCVLNERKGVSVKTIARVMTAVDRLDYHRDIHAANLATRKEYRFHFVVPRGPNAFMTTLGERLRAAVARLFLDRVAITVAEYVDFDNADLARTLGALSPRTCMGAAVVAEDSATVRGAIDDLAGRGVPVLTLVSDVWPSRRLHAVGINSVAAGRVAATLIGRFLGRRGGKVGMTAVSMTRYDQAQRRLGFQQTIFRDFPDLEILPPLECHDDTDLTVKLVTRLLAEQPTLAALYNVGAGNRGIIEALEKSGRQSAVVVVSHELTEHSRRALINGTFDAVLHQDIDDEIEAAVRVLKAHADGDAGFAPPNIGIDIFLRDNLP